MARDLCSECKEWRSDVARCECGFLEICQGSPVCKGCGSAHRYVGKFVRLALATKRTLRSGSNRAKALEILHVAIARFRNMKGGDPVIYRQATRALDQLRELSAYSDDRDYRGGLLDAVRSVPVTNELADCLREEIKDAKFWRAIGIFQEAARQQQIENDANAAVAALMNAIDSEHSEQRFQAKILEILNR